MERQLGSGFQVGWRTEVLVAVVLVLVLGSVPTAWTQPGFLNIDCGAPASYVDPVTGLSWEPDTPYVSSGKTQTVTLPTSLAGFTEMQTLRFFDDARAKNCYALPVTHNASYLLKVTFFYGNYDNANLAPAFQLAIDANIVTNMTLTDTDGAYYDEYHYMARGNLTQLCFLRTSGSFSPFISGISLKEAESLTTGAISRYKSDLAEGIIISTLSRVNFGGTSFIRSPTDYYDRFWFPEGNTSLYHLTPSIVPYQFLSTSLSIPFIESYPAWPPSQVLQSAVTSYGRIRTYLLPKGSPVVHSSVFFLFYYAELNGTVPTPLRNFTIEIPYATTLVGTVDMEYYDFLDFGRWYFSLYDKTLDTSTTAFLTPLLSAQAGPILNCMEIFARSEPRLRKTGDRDALAISYIKKSLNLTEWSGDPCVPVPHSWIKCSVHNPTVVDPQPVVTAMNLSGYHLVGTLDASFAQLQDLASLDLSNNGLSGPLPEWLTTLTGLTRLAVQNNNFSGPIPAGLRSANLMFTYEGNPFLGTQAPPGPGIAPGSSKSSKSNIAVIAGASAGGVVVLALITVLAILAYCRCKRRRISGEEQRANMRIPTPGGAKSYTFAEVTAATSQFRRELGRGGFGPVYYGKLPDGQEVAVKVADGKSQHEQRAFFTEVDVLSRVHHKHLVSLVGYCQEQKQILIYEYVHNGSLFDHLHSPAVCNSTLNWRTRLQIALNAAQGVDYLHSSCSPSFIHRDVKSSNILLTPKFEAKVADFGLTKLMGETEDTRVMTNNVMGTAGYLDPEYYSTHYISSKSDVYSFGIVLLELLTGGLPIEKSNGRNPNIANWVRESLQNNDINSILDPEVVASNPKMESIWKIAEIAMQCVEPKGVHRPTMTEVVQEIHGALVMEAMKMSLPFSQPHTLHSSQPSGLSDYSSGLYGPTSHPTPR